MWTTQHLEIIFRWKPVLFHIYAGLPFSGAQQNGGLQKHLQTHGTSLMDAGWVLQFYAWKPSWDIFGHIPNVTFPLFAEVETFLSIASHPCTTSFWASFGSITPAPRSAKAVKRADLWNFWGRLSELSSQESKNTQNMLCLGKSLSLDVWFSIAMVDYRRVYIHVCKYVSLTCFILQHRCNVEEVCHMSKHG